MDGTLQDGATTPIVEEVPVSNICLVPYSPNPPSPPIEFDMTSLDSPTSTERSTAKDYVFILIEDLLMLAQLQDAAVLDRFKPAIEAAHLEICGLLDSLRQTMSSARTRGPLEHIQPGDCLD